MPALRVLAYTILPSASLFFSGVGALYLADVVISRSGNPEAIATWATLKSFMMVGSTLALFGMEQLLVREPRASRLLIRIALINIVVVAVLAGAVGAYAGYTPSFIIGALAIAGFALSNLSFQWLRSNLVVTRAYIASGAWRVLFLAGTIALVAAGAVAYVPQMLIVALLLGGLIIAWLLWRTPAKSDLVSLHDDVKTVWNAFSLSATYFIASLSLAIASYGENLVVRQLGTTDDVVIYFQAAVLFLFPGAMLNQYLSAVMAPVVRQEESRVTAALRRNGGMILGAIAVIWPLLVGFGYVLELLFHGEVRTSLWLAALLALTSCVRLFYVLPSTFVGMLASKRQLRITTALYLGCALLLPVLSYLFVSMGMNVLYAVATANLISWLSRCAVGTTLVAQRIALPAAESA